MVRMMNPPFSSGGSRCCSLSRRCARSSSSWMRCEIPMWDSWGRYTRSLPAMLICVDSLAPLLPIGSLTTCTIRFWPSASRRSIGREVSPLWRVAPVSGPRRNAGRAPPLSVETACPPARSRPHPPDRHHSAGVDVADQAARRGALYVHFLRHALLDHRHARLLRGDVDEDFFGHCHGATRRVGSKHWNVEPLQEVGCFRQRQSHDTG